MFLWKQGLLRTLPLRCHNHLLLHLLGFCRITPTSHRIIAQGFGQTVKLARSCTESQQATWWRRTGKQIPKGHMIHSRVMRLLGLRQVMVGSEPRTQPRLVLCPCSALWAVSVLGSLFLYILLLVQNVREGHTGEEKNYGCRHNQR